MQLSGHIKSGLNKGKYKTLGSFWAAQKYQTLTSCFVRECEVVG